MTTATRYSHFSRFVFDPLAGEESSNLGRLTILQARISPDYGDEVMKVLDA